MNILILGIDHEIQKVDAWRSNEMKEAYRNLLGLLIEQHAAQAICEEADSIHETVGHQLAGELGLPFGWTNIDMREQARQEAGIFEEQMNRVPVQRAGKVHTHFEDGAFYLDLKNGTHLFCPRVPSDAVREDYMRQRVIEGVGQANSVLVLCGNFHIEGLAVRLGLLGNTVQTDAVYNYDWYDSGY
jgi:hypothetical protein